MKRVAIAVLLIGLLTFSNLPQVATAQTAPWIDPTATMNYVDNMISSYDALASNDALYLNFTSVEPHLTLYHSVGNSFEVIALRTLPNNDSFVSFIFVPFASNNPVLVINSTVALDDFYPIVGSGEGSILEHNQVTYNDTITNFALIWGVHVSDVLNNTDVNSKNAAEAVYQTDITQASAAILETRIGPSRPRLLARIQT